MASGVTVAYNGNVIHQMAGNGTFKMNTQGAYMEGDVDVVVDVAGGGGGVSEVADPIHIDANSDSIFASIVSGYPQFNAANAFGTQKRCWWGANDASQHWISVTFEKAVKIKKVKFSNYWGDGTSIWQSTSVTFQGSNDGTNWTDLLTLTNLTASETQEQYDVNNDTEYLYYRFLCVSNATYYTGLGKIQLYVEVTTSGGGGAKNILSGTDAPASNVGQDGDIYLEYLNIPTGCVALEYIESTGTQYIDTLFTPNQDTSLEVDVAVKELSPSVSFTPISDNSKNTSANRFGIGYDSNKKVQYNYNVYHYGTASVNLNERHKIALKKNVAYIDGKQDGTFSETTFTSPSSLFAFGGYVGSSEIRKTKIRLYSLKLWNGDTLVRNFIPIKDANDTVCLYDSVNDDYYYNSGTGNFVAGDELDSNAIINAYCKVNGSWQALEGTDIDDVNTEEKDIDAIPDAYQKVDWIKTGSSFSCIYAYGYDMRVDDVIEFYAKADDWTQTSGGKAYYSILGLKENMSSGSGARGWIGVDNTLKKKIFSQFATLYGDDLEYSKSAGSSAIDYGSVSDSNAKVLLKFSPQANAVPRGLFIGGYLNNEYAINTKIYKITVKRADGTLVMNLIPCYRKADSVVGVFDTITWRFITASNGTFTCGTDS